MMLETSFLLVGGKKNDLEELFSMYSEKYLCEYFTLALIFSAIEANWLLKIFAISTGFVAVLLLWFKGLKVQKVDSSKNLPLSKQKPGNYLSKQ